MRSNPKSLLRTFSLKTAAGNADDQSDESEPNTVASMRKKLQNSVELMGPAVCHFPITHSQCFIKSCASFYYILIVNITLKAQTLSD